MSKNILDTVHEEAKGLYKAGVIDAKTLQEFEKICGKDITRTTHRLGRLKNIFI